MKAPCTNCEKRLPGCHGSCDKYAEWKTEQDRIRDARANETEINNMRFLYRTRRKNAKAKH